MIKADIIIPIFNEGEAIKNVLNHIKENLLSPHRILICYDSDNDPTLNFIDFNQHPNILLVKNPLIGPCEAIKEGFNQAEADYVIVFPADDLINGNILDKMIQVAENGFEIVVASRFMKGGSMEGCPFIKSILVRTASATLYLLSSIPVRDASNGFRLFSKNCLEQINIESTTGFTYSIELLVKATRIGLNIAEVPAQWLERDQGESNFKIKSWIFDYLRWYFYGLATSWLRKKPSKNCIKTYNT